MKVKVLPFIALMTGIFLMSGCNAKDDKADTKELKSESFDDFAPELKDTSANDRSPIRYRR